MEREVAARIARRFDSWFLRGYAFGKLLTDPMYEAVAERLETTTSRIVDIGCGIGLAPLYLRSRGMDVPMIGIDFDDRKIDAARRAAADLSDVRFKTGDARDVLAEGDTILLLDVLHYFSSSERAAILQRAAAAGRTVLVRDALRDGSWRYRLTAFAERLARAVFWLKAERLDFPSRTELLVAFEGFTAEVLPMYGRTPFNNYLLVFRRESSGITNS